MDAHSYHMEVVEEERQEGPPALNYTHKILPGVSTLENYGCYYPAPIYEMF